MKNSTFYADQLSALQALSGHPLDGMLRGIEKENLRVNAQGHYVKTAHPESLGSALLHPFITTDFSEALIECITPAVTSRQAAFGHLRSISAWVAQTLNDQESPEALWPYSMPYLTQDIAAEQALLADYGTSNSAKMKQIYRKGLVARYGPAMQLIAGIHYNVSFPESLIQHLGALPGFDADPDEGVMRSQRYMGLIRNFIRHQWVLAYLFGATPACFSGSFPKNSALPLYLNQASLTTAYGKATCSLRLSDLGYHNSNQASIQLGFADIKGYAKDLLSATQIPDCRLYCTRTISESGEYLQLNRNLLQLENEYYFNIRPKPDPVLTKNLRPAVALHKHGVKYIELRGLDLDPFSPLGLSQETAAFCDCFLLHMLISDSAAISHSEKTQAHHNLKTAVEVGRSESAQIADALGHHPMNKTLTVFLSSMRPLARWMDSADSGLACYEAALEKQIEVANGKRANHSERVMNEWKDSGTGFREFMLTLQQQHTDELLAEPLSESFKKECSAVSAESLRQQKTLEQESTQAFESYLNDYFSQTLDSRES